MRDSGRLQVDARGGCRSRRRRRRAAARRRGAAPAARRGRARCAAPPSRPSCPVRPLLRAERHRGDEPLHRLRHEVAAQAAQPLGPVARRRRRASPARRRRSDRCQRERRRSSQQPRRLADAGQASTTASASSPSTRQPAPSSATDSTGAPSADHRRRGAHDRRGGGRRASAHAVRAARRRPGPAGARPATACREEHAAVPRGELGDLRHGGEAEPVGVGGVDAADERIDEPLVHLVAEPGAHERADRVGARCRCAAGTARARRAACRRR